MNQTFHSQKEDLICGTTNDPGIDARGVALLVQTKQNEAKNVFLSLTR